MEDISFNDNSRAEILVKALPYIQQYRGKTVVVKYGGNAMINEELKAGVIRDVVLMSCVGVRTILVHGGGPEIEAMLKKTGKESRFVRGLRYTDDETMEIVQMVLAGKVNKDIVSLIQRAGGKALGICGIDGALLEAERLRPEGEDLGRVGEIKQVNRDILDMALDRNIVPVIATVALGRGPEAGFALNINADTAAAKIAAAMGAEKIILMTDVQGILRDVHDPASLIKETSQAELEVLKRDGIVSKGMIPKVDCCKEALDGGVAKASIIDGRVPHALLIEMFTERGIGTMIRRAC